MPCLDRFSLDRLDQHRHHRRNPSRVTCRIQKPMFQRRRLITVTGRIGRVFRIPASCCQGPAPSVCRTLQDDPDGMGRRGRPVLPGSMLPIALARRVPRRISARVVCGRHQGTVLLLGLVAGLAAACGGDSAGPAPPPPPPPPPPNRAPTAVGTLPAVRVAVGESSEVQLSGAFRDPDGDALSYSAVTSNANAATVSVSASVATVTGVAKGVATISVMATDPGGASARQVLT